MLSSGWQQQHSQMLASPQQAGAWHTDVTAVEFFPKLTSANVHDVAGAVEHLLPLVRERQTHGRQLECKEFGQRLECTRLGCIGHVDTTGLSGNHPQAMLFRYAHAQLLSFSGPYETQPCCGCPAWGPYHSGLCELNGCC
jgi:hypothetical protein